MRKGERYSTLYEICVLNLQYNSVDVGVKFDWSKTIAVFSILIIKTTWTRLLNHVVWFNSCLGLVELGTSQCVCKIDPQWNWDSQIDWNVKCILNCSLYVAGSPIVKISKEKIDAVDEGKKAITYSVIDGDLLKYFKKFQAHLVIVPKGDGALAKWHCDYEKASDEVPDPHVIKDFAVKNFQEVDAYIHNT